MSHSAGQLASFRGVSSGFLGDASQGGIELGAGANATAGSAIAVGDISNATNLDAIAIGRNTFATDVEAIAIGDSAIADNFSCVALGAQSSTNGIVQSMSLNATGVLASALPSSTAFPLGVGVNTAGVTGGAAAATTAKLGVVINGAQYHINLTLVP